MNVAAVISPPPPAGRTPSHRRHRARTIAVAVMAGLVAWQAPSIIPLAVGAFTVAVSANPAWLVGGLCAAAASMVALALLRQRTLRAAGGKIGLAEATVLTYAAGAVHLTAPAGSVLACGYLFRRLRQRGLRPVAIGYSLVISGLIASLTLALLAAAGLLNGPAADVTSTLSGAAAIIGIAAATWAVRHPDTAGRVAVGALTRINRTLHRPAATGRDALRQTVHDLGQIRATRTDWTMATMSAAANWLLDLGCLWACTHAVGLSTPAPALLTGYALAMAATGISPWPGGLGVVDAALVITLTTAGAPTTAALGAVLLYRLISNGSVILGGWIAVAAHSTHHRAGTPKGQTPTSVPAT